MFDFKSPGMQAFPTVAVSSRLHTLTRGSSRAMVTFLVEMFPGYHRALPRVRPAVPQKLTLVAGFTFRTKNPGILLSSVIEALRSQTEIWMLSRMWRGLPEYILRQLRLLGWHNMSSSGLLLKGSEDVVAMEIVFVQDIEMLVSCSRIKQWQLSGD